MVPARGRTPARDGQIVDEDRVTMFGTRTHISAAVKQLDLAVRERNLDRIRQALAGVL